MSRQRLKRSRPRKLNVEQLCSRRLLAGDMTNPADPYDTNNDKSVTAGDALVVINYLDRQNGAAAGENAGPSTSKIYPDTNGDLSVSALDALMVINRLVEGEDTTNNDEADDYGGGSTRGEPVIRSLDIDTGNSPQIEFSGDNVYVRVTSPTHGILRFNFGGQSEDISIGYDLIIRASGHGNRLEFDGAYIPDDLIIRVTGDDNAVALFDTHVGDDFIYQGGDGRDGVVLGWGTYIDDNVQVYGREGNDTFLIQHAQIGNDLFYYANDGHDLLAIDGVTVHDDAIIRLGDDNDELSAWDVTVHDVVNVEGDRDFDSIAVDNIMARRIHEDEFETEGNLRNVSQLIDQLFGFGPVLGTGDVQVTLRWSGDADLDLHVIDPFGEEIDFGNETSNSGGTLDVDIVPECGLEFGPHVENVFWATGTAPNGTFQAFVDTFDLCDDSPVSYQFEIRVDGVVVASDSGTLTSDGQDSPTIMATRGVSS